MKIGRRSDSLSLGATFNGAAMGIEFVNGYSICASWTDGGGLAGTLKLQASNNPFTDNVNMTPAADAVWVDVTGSSIAVSGAGSQFWNVADANYSAYRIVWTRTAGSGTLTAYHLIKGPQ
jgi:hypothetical protein